jgi:uncharacterized protein DUF4177
MQKWEYLMLAERLGGGKFKWDDTGKASSDQSVQSRLDEMGRQGWELVHVCSYMSMGSTHSYEFYFKRPLE